MTKTFIIAILVAGVLAMAAAALRGTKFERALKHASHSLAAVAIIAAVVALTMAGGAAVRWFIPKSQMVTVTVVHGGEPDRFVTLRMPRRALAPLSGAPRDETFTLPMLPFSASLPYAGDMVPGPPRTGSVPRGRLEQTEIQVRVVGKGIPTSRLFRNQYEPVSGAHLVDLPPYDGLRTVENRTAGPNSKPATGAVLFFPTHEDDLFDVIICPTEHRHPLFFCEYRKRLTDVVSLDVSFVDFRYHGGRKFANHRMRSVFKRYCEYNPSCAWEPSD